LGQPGGEGVKVDDDDDVAVPELSMDYCFVRREEKDEVVTVLVLKDCLGGHSCSSRLAEGAESEPEVVRIVECVRTFRHRGKVVLSQTGNQRSSL
jgi:hypothetical protein